MLPTLARFSFSILSGCSWIGFHLIRLAERALPQPLLTILLRPIAFFWGLTQPTKQRAAVKAWQRLSVVRWAPSQKNILLWQGFASHHARLVYLFPDRLPERRWLSRSRLIGSSDPLQMQASGRRIVFASLHLGPFETLPYWLRAHGLAVTTLVGRKAPRQWLKQRQYSLSPPSGLPVVLPVTEKGGIRHAVSGLQHLLVFMDVNRGRQLELPLEGLIFQLASGVIRIAALTGAELAPCLTTVAAGWRFSIFFGRPVPQELLGAEPDLAGAGLHLLREFLPVIQTHPAQCGSRLLSCIRAA